MTTAQQYVILGNYQFENLTKHWFLILSLKSLNFKSDLKVTVHLGRNELMMWWIQNKFQFD